MPPEKSGGGSWALFPAPPADDAGKRAKNLDAIHKRRKGEVRGNTPQWARRFDSAAPHQRRISFPVSCSGLDVKETGGSWRPDKSSNAVDRASKMRGVSRGRAPVPSPMRYLESGTSFNTRAGVRAVRFRLTAPKAGRPFRDRVSVL